ncbi:M48 family metallopeptidase [Candidatus Gottesmanbacteria bacterium]|nr:M48 family metallopeptidase [Candidatus Gottesmanbacteria bacterium]
MNSETDDLNIDILKRGNRRTVSIHLTRDGKLEVRAPYLVLLFMIRRFVSSKREWILRAKQKIALHAKKKIVSYIDGSVIRLAGEEYSLKYTDGTSILKVGKTLLFPRKFLSKPSFHFALWARKEAKKILLARTKYYAEIMDVSFTRVSIRDTSSRWGSCSRTGSINYCWRLILADLSVLDYVVIHELSHISHHNHGKDFWKRVERFCSLYKIYRAWLKNHGDTLVV